MRITNRFVGVAVITSRLFICHAVGAKEPKAPAPEKPAQAATAVAKSQAYLGIGVSSLPPALASQLADTLGEGRGVLIVEVSPDSPAAKAGIKPHDVLVTYNDQKLYSPEQLVKLVRSDRVGGAVTIELVRAGKAAAVQLTLGRQPEVAPQSAFRLPGLLEHRQQPQTTAERAERWRTFDSLSLTRLDEHRFKAEVKFRDDEGKIETHAYEGTHDEIRKAIDAEKHLPADERRHLLRALDLPDHPFEFPGFHLVPGGGVHWDFEESTR